MNYQKFKIKNAIKTQNSLEKKLLFLQILLVVFIVFGIVVVLFLTGIFGTSNKQSYNIINGELSRTEKNLSNKLVAMSQTCYTLSKDINNSINSTLKEKNISIASISSNPKLLTTILSKEVEKCLFSMQKTNSSGVFIILNATVNPLTPNSEFSKTGFYIKNTEPTPISYTSNIPILLRGSSDIARKHKMYLDTEWQLEFYLDKNSSYCDYFYNPFNNGILYSNNDKKLLGFWSSPFQPDANQNRVITFSVPLIDKSGIIYGVCGLEISQQFLTEHVILSTEHSINISYLIAKQSNVNDTFNVSNSLKLGEKSNLLLDDYILYIDEVNNDNFNTYKTKDVEATIYSIEKTLNLYNSKNVNASDKWILLAYSHENPSDSIAVILKLALFILFIIAILLAYGISKVYTRPIKSSFNKIIDNQKSIDKTDIVEIDALIDFIEKIQSQEIIEEEEKRNIHNENNMESSNIEKEKQKEFKSQLDSLTKTEREIFNLLMKGFSTKQICEDRCITINTLKSHNSKIYSKMNIRSRSQLLTYCFQMMSNYFE